MRSRSNSYTLKSPIFAVDQLPEINSIKEQQTDHPEKDEAPTSLESGIVEELTHDDEIQIQKEAILDDKKLTREELVEKEEPKREEEEPKTPLPNDTSRDTYDFFQPQMKSQLQDLIKRQKEEYLDTVNVLKRRFLNEQQHLLEKLQTNMQIMTSTPLQNVSIAPTEDEEFTEFQTCLQSNNVETTLTHDQEEKEKAATIINAYARGYLVRRLLKTVYVQECVRNIRDTLQFILTLEHDGQNNDEIQDILLKTKIFHQLQGDLYRLYGIFSELPTCEKMKLIADDRERHVNKFSKANREHINRNFQVHGISK